MQTATRERGPNNSTTNADDNNDDPVSLEPLSSALQPPFQYNASLHWNDAAASQAHPTIESIDSPHPHSSPGPGLRLQTETLAKLQSQTQTQTFSTSTNTIASTDPQIRQTIIASGIPYRSSSVRSTLSASHFTGGSLSPASAVSSPGLGPIIDITPLPSPVTAAGSPRPWRRSIDSQDPRDPLPEIAELSTPMTSTQELVASGQVSPKKRRVPASLASSTKGTIYDVNASSHARNRSISDYAPNPIQVLRNRNIVVSGTGLSLLEHPIAPPGQHMHREEYLAIQRGLTAPGPKPPTPPRSNRGADSSDLESDSSSPDVRKTSLPLRYEARTVQGGKLRHWRAVRQLGKGTFSTVMLATSQDAGGAATSSQSMDFLRDHGEESQINFNSLVAVKVCEFGPAGGADAQKVETSLKRELEIMKAIDHPSLVHLKAFNILDRRAFLVLNYCPGGDLFELANLKPELLIPGLIRRIFTELVAAVQYLHAQYIVHRDVKLENVLVNIPTEAIATVSDWQSYPSPVVTLTDLGLGRWIPKPPESPLLETRCGSEDYAAPEVLLGQQYDGRATDAWALGVLLYAIMEERLPFDQLPSSKRKSQKSHRIARCEWAWVKWGTEDGEWNSARGAELEGARAIVEGLLVRARSRWSLDKVAESEWVRGGMMLDEPLQRVDEHDADDQQR